MVFAYNHNNSTNCSVHKGKGGIMPPPPILTKDLADPWLQNESHNSSDTYIYILHFDPAAQDWL